ncbi:MAG: hypothetical protein JXR82_14090 [Marinifilaceae bacterium]|nr:hypothetical protein [Marinifilaceae bacterium]
MKKAALFLMIILPLVTIGQRKKDNSMTHILKNKNLEIHIDLPLKNYSLSRFDWTGKITAVKFKGIPVSGEERTDAEDANNFGKGFYNEFGIETPIGFDEIKAGEYFPKIGVGALKKEGQEYSFSKAYETEPADFKIGINTNKLIIECVSQIINGYSYVLKKEIELLESSFVIRYHLHNTGVKIISTNEYCHNFLAINKELIGSQYILKFPFDIKPELFRATVNPEEKVVLEQREITFKSTPNEQFFFSNLSGSKTVDARWELINTKTKIGISETGSFATNKINLWGWKHVISPELFFDINLKPGQTIEWFRTYNLFEIR